MIHEVNATNQHLYGPQLDQMFRMRHAFYVEGHKWAGLTSTNGRETDEFDTLDAVYLMSLDPFGGVAASVRLNPTTGPTLLGKFADHADAPLPRSEDCWDISRWIAQPQHRRGAEPRWRTNHQRELMLGILEFCLSRGVARLTMLAELRLAERIAAYGWPLAYLGAPRSYENGKGMAVAAEIRTGPDVLIATRNRTGVLTPMLYTASATHARPNEDLSPSSELEAVVADIGDVAAHRFIRALVHGLGRCADAGDVEMAHAIMRLAEAAGLRGQAGGGALPSEPAKPEAALRGS